MDGETDYFIEDKYYTLALEEENADTDSEADSDPEL